MHHSHEPRGQSTYASFPHEFCDTSHIRTSWQRCREKYKISPQSKVELCTLTEKEIQKKREPLEQLLLESAPIIERVRRISKESGYSLLISNAEGATIKTFTDSDLALELQSRGIRIGTLWREAVAGTNALGTCLEEKRPITVDAGEHYSKNLQPFSCSAAPIFGADGSVLGALGMSTFANGNRMGQALALNFITETAEEIEALIFRSAYSQQNIVGLSCSVPSSTALIAFNDSGTVIAATKPALQHLRCRNRYDLVGKSIEDAFGLHLDELAQATLLEHKFQLNGHGHHYCLTLNTVQTKASQASAGKSPLPKLPGSTPESSRQPLLEAAGKDPALLEQARRCMRIIDNGLTVLLQGETGTGKEVWARALHNTSARKDKPFVAVNCAAIPESLIESELFGYGAGTFTGGLKSGKTGKIEASNGGTLFLDEIGDMPAELQARLLRVLAENEIVPLGEVKPTPVDINVICASHRDLEHHVCQGKFREDLYYRISVFKTVLPPLRERKDKIHLIYRVLNSLQPQDDADIRLSAEAEEVLVNYQWPGNIRQLKNVLQYAVCMCNGSEINTNDLPNDILKPVTVSAETTIPKISTQDSDTTDTEEKRQLITVLEQNRWIVTRAAKALGISRSTMHRKIKLHGLLLGPQEG